jgi:SAM-dependent methyltransferase
MESNPPQGIQIKATDRNQYMIDGCQEFAAAGDWPVQATVMTSQDLTFPNDYFTYSFSNFFITHLEENHDPAAKNVYRTIKPGGTAIVSTWAAMAHGEPIKRAHLETRGPDVAFPMAMPEHWYHQDALKNFFTVGGFKEDNIKIKTCDVYIEAKDLRRLMSATWSFLGARTDGWYPEDEENWDKAVDILVNDIKAGPFYSKLPSGNISLRMVANIGLGTK